MADPVGTDPQADPIGQASVAVAATNIKTFGDLQLQYANLALANAVGNQSRLDTYAFQSLSRAEALNSGVIGRAVNMMLDPMNTSVGDAALASQGAKIAETTPPDTSGQLTALAAQLSFVVQALQGLTLRSSVSGV